MHRDDLAAPLRWLRRCPPPLFDGAIAVAFVAIVAAEQLQGPLHADLSLVVTGVVTVVLTGSLLARRAFPLAAFVIGTAVMCGAAVLHVPSVAAPLADQVLVYSLGVYGTRARARWGLPMIVAGVVVYFAGIPGSTVLDPLTTLLVWVATWAVGYTTARRREEQDVARRAVRQQVVAEEQTRMARELHDVVGHTVSLLVVQAGAARLMLDKNPAQTREFLTAMEKTGREALADLDQVLGTLRSQSAAGDADGGSVADLNASPGLDQLPSLVNRLNRSGIDVTLSMDAGLRLPHNIDLSAYRIVQEALTNVLKHAGPCSATVSVRQDAHAAVVEVSDNGRGLSDANTRGRGLLGIAERVSMCGGVLEHGAGGQGGFRVRAALPLP